ncbi:glycosyltransferase family 4 protein [Shewanella fodinae]|nr:glycosyltransferase family 4 protein [Shewanella fodinae]
MKKFATIFKNFEEVHLTKDVGMIPMAMSKILGQKSKIFYWKRNRIEEVKNNYKELIDLHPVKACNCFIFYAKVFYYLLIYKIDIVNLYHIGKHVIIFSFLCKYLKIKTFIKLDMALDTVATIDSWFKKNNLRSKSIRAMINNVSLITVEEDVVLNKLTDIDKVFKKIERFNNSLYEKTVKDLEIKEKKKIFLIVGRIGAYQKNHELILDALKNIRDFKGWKFVFVGNVEDKFYELVNEFECDGVNFIGNKNREELFKLYSESSVFVMTSRWEGFSLALLESAYMGCYVISTDVGGVMAITNKGQYGEVINQNDVDSLCLALKKIIDGHNDIQSNLNERITYVRANFNLEKNLRKIDWQKI